MATFLMLSIASSSQAVSDLFRQAEELERQGFFDDAIQAWKTVLAAKPEKVERINAQIKLSIDLYKAGQFDAALEQAQTLVKSDPESFDANFNLGNALSSMSRFPEAVAPYEKAIQLRPDEGLAYVGLALSQFGDGLSNKAIDRLTQAKNLFKEKKNISWHRDTQLMMQQIKMFVEAQYPPNFSSLWLKTSLKQVRDTYEKNVFNQ